MIECSAVHNREAPVSDGTKQDRDQEPSRSAGEWRRNRIVGWVSLATGVGTGLVLGLWSFDGPVPTPTWLGDYGETARRLVRLGHIALFGLGILNILIARELPRLSLGGPARQAASVAMNFGNVFLPLSLFAAAAYRPLKYLMPFPALAVFLALIIAISGVCREKQGNGDAHR